MHSCSEMLCEVWGRGWSMCVRVFRGYTRRSTTPTRPNARRTCVQSAWRTRQSRGSAAGCSGGWGAAGPEAGSPPRGCLTARRPRWRKIAAGRPGSRTRLHKCRGQSMVHSGSWSTQSQGHNPSAACRATGPRCLISHNVAPTRDLQTCALYFQPDWAGSTHQRSAPCTSPLLPGPTGSLRSR